MTDKHVLDLLRKRQLLTDKAYQKALSGVYHRNTKRAVGLRLTVFGTGLILAGITCFVAANWQYVGAVLKFALPLAGLLVCALGAYYKKLETVPGQAFAFGMGCFIGLFLAVFGQTYQTGAFLYEFFGLWFLLLIPLGMAAKNKWLWLLSFYIGGLYILSKGAVVDELRVIYPQFVFFSLAAWVLAIKCRLSRAFQRWFWVPVGIYVWGFGMEHILFGNTLFHSVGQNYFWGAVLLSVVECYWAHRAKDSVLFGWNMLLLAGLMLGLIWYQNYREAMGMMSLSVLVCAGAGAASYGFWRAHREDDL